jgi:serine protease AprX
MNESCCRPVAAAAAALVGFAAAFAGVGEEDFTSNPDPQATEYTLRLGEVSFDPLLQAPVLPEGWESIEAEGPQLRLVQLTGPTHAASLDQLEDAGLAIVQYIHPYTYIVWSDAQNLEAVRGVGAVRWAGEFHPAYRVQPQWRNLPDQPVAVTTLLYRGVDTDAVVRAIADLGGRSTGRRVLNRTFETAGFEISGARLRDVALIPGVYSVKPVPTDGGLRSEMSDQVCAGNYDGSNLAYPGYQAWLTGVGLDGTGVILADVDGGVQDSHPDLAGRLIPCSGQTCGGGASSSHGTHTAGIMAADGTSGTLDGFGFLRGLGIAPGANLVEQVYSPWFTQPGGMLLLMTESYANGAVASGNSWGPSGSPQGYDDDTLQVDIGARDTDPDTPGDQPLCYVLSIMNGNGGTSSQGTPDEAKNIFTIGSTWMQHGDGSQRLNIDDLSSNSAHGPCLDGRKVPHMVAPGCDVDSTVTGSGYGLMCGTSMASPHVTGAVALFVEHYRNRPDYTTDPSPAMIKAAFLPVAHDLAGEHDADNGILGHPFDNKQGWGRMDLPAVVAPVPGSVRYFDNPVVFDNTGEEWSVVLSPLDPSKPMKIMLVWTDAPGHGLGGSTPAWNNDLDLVVEVSGTYYGNNFGFDGYSVTGGGPDIMNNTEGVFLGPIPPGAATVRVVATNINSDGLPNSGDGTDQDFALVAYNAAEEPGFAINAAPSAQEICAPDDAVYDLDIIQILGYTETVTLSASGHPAGTTVTFGTNPVVPPALTTMTVSGTGGAAYGDYSLDITGTTIDLTRDTTVGLGLFTVVPDAPGLIAPSNGATEVSVVPTLQWSASAQAASYDLQIATDPGFGNIVYSATVTETSHGVEQALDITTQYSWRVAASNTCGDGSFSAAWSFTTQDLPPVLLVDDDDNGPDVRSYYTDTLDALGVWHDTWDTNNSDDEPTAQDLAPYEVVIWFTGDEFGGACGPGSAGEAALAEWLAGGGCLLISSQDYYYDRGLTSFMASYLGVLAVSSDVNQTSVTGAGPVFGGMGPYALSYPFSNYSDTVNPRGGPDDLAFAGNVDDAGILNESPAHRSTFWGFPLEAIPDVNDRADLLLLFLDWCGGLQQDCPGDFDGDGEVGVTDFLQMLGAWGPNPGHPADLNGDGEVNVTDFLELLAVWGPCP